jgi:hypothetical protein
MKKRYTESFTYHFLNRIKRLRKEVILRKDVEGWGEPRQITRAFDALVEKGELVRLGYGVYAKAYYSPRLNKPVIKEGFEAACLDALKRLGIPFEPSQAEKNYNEGKSTQVPAYTMVHLKKRFRGRLSYSGQDLLFEDKINAR